MKLFSFTTVVVLLVLVLIASVDAKKDDKTQEKKPQDAGGNAPVHAPGAKKPNAGASAPAKNGTVATAELCPIPYAAGNDWIGAGAFRQYPPAKGDQKGYDSYLVTCDEKKVLKCVGISKKKASKDVGLNCQKDKGLQAAVKQRVDKEIEEIVADIEKEDTGKKPGQVDAKKEGQQKKPTATGQQKKM